MLSSQEDTQRAGVQTLLAGSLYLISGTARAIFNNVLGVAFKYHPVWLFQTEIKTA